MNLLLSEFFSTIKLSMSLRNLSVVCDKIINSNLCKQNIYWLKYLKGPEVGLVIDAV